MFRWLICLVVGHDWITLSCKYIPRVDGTRGEREITKQCARCKKMRVEAEAFELGTSRILWRKAH